MYCWCDNLLKKYTEHLTVLQSGVEGVEQQAGHGHGAYAARHRRDGRALGGHLVELHVAADAIALW